MTRATTGSSAAFPAFGATPTMFLQALEALSAPGDTSGYQKRLDGIPLIASETAVLSMQAAGIDVVGFSNNHCFDYGKGGYDNSRAFFDSTGLTHAGAIPDDTRPDVPPYTVITAGKRQKDRFHRHHLGLQPRNRARRSADNKPFHVLSLYHRFRTGKRPHGCLSAQRQ